MGVVVILTVFEVESKLQHEVINRLSLLSKKKPIKR